MVDNLIKGVIVGVLAFVWYYAGVEVQWINLGSFPVTGVGPDYTVPGLGYLFFTFLAFTLARSAK